MMIGWVAVNLCALLLMKNVKNGAESKMVNKPWFVGKDVAKALGYSNSRDALSKHVDDEDRG